MSINIYNINSLNAENTLPEQRDSHSSKKNDEKSF